MATMDTEAVKRRLDEREAEIDRLQREIHREAEGMGSGELADHDQHPGDRGTETLEEEIDETTEMMLEAERGRVEEARQALAEGRYGVCVDCGREIPAARLEAQPEAIRCVEDQSRLEGGRRQRGG